MLSQTEGRIKHLKPEKMAPIFLFEYGQAFDLKYYLKVFPGQVNDIF